MDNDLNKARQYLDALNLSYIIDAMCATNYPLPRWTVADATFCCQLYKNFLFLIKKYPKIQLVPSRSIDEFWHNHILYTKKYHYDCLQIFGDYLHHEPADPKDDEKKLIDIFSVTKQLYFEEFKQPLILERAS